MGQRIHSSSARGKAWTTSRQFGTKEFSMIQPSPLRGTYSQATRQGFCDQVDPMTGKHVERQEPHNLPAIRFDIGDEFAIHNCIVVKRPHVRKGESQLRYIAEFVLPVNLQNNHRRLVRKSIRKLYPQTALNASIPGKLADRHSHAAGNKEGREHHPTFQP